MAKASIMLVNSILHHHNDWYMEVCPWSNWAFVIQNKITYFGKGKNNTYEVDVCYSIHYILCTHFSHEMKHAINAR